MSTTPPAPSGDAPLRLEQYLPYRLNVVAVLAAGALGRIYDAEFGIGIPEWRVIAQLGEFGRLTARDIGDLAKMHKTKVSRAVAQLEERGFVQRSENRKDRRESFVTLSPRRNAALRADRPAGIGFPGPLDRRDCPGRIEGVRARALDADRTQPASRRRL